MSDIPPTGDGNLLPWSNNFAARVSADFAALGLSAADAALYAGLHADYAALLAVAATPATHTRPALAAKNAAKTTLLARARQFARVIKANPTVTDARRADLGLPPRDVTPSPIPPPASRPLLIVDPFGNVGIRDEATPGRRRKPRTVLGAVLFTKLAPAGAPAPTSPADAQYAGVATRDKFALPLPPNAAGQVLWVLAHWINEKGQAGPVSAVVWSRVAA